MRESRKLTNEDVARILGLPATSVGITELATFSYTEQKTPRFGAECDQARAADRAGR